MVKESRSFIFQEIDNNSTNSWQTDWHLLPWNQIEKFVFLMQSKIYNVSFSKSKKKLHELQTLFVKSYAVKLFVSKQISESRVNEQHHNVCINFNTLNSSQKIQVALSIDVSMVSRQFDLNKDLIPFCQVATKHILYLSLRPEWEAYSKQESGLQLFDRNVHSLIQSIIHDLNLSQFSSRLYIATLVLEKDVINLDAVLSILSTINEFALYIKYFCNNDFKNNSIFLNLDASCAKLDVKSLEHLLSHILLLSCEKPIDQMLNLNKQAHFRFYRYQNTIMFFSDSMQNLYDFFKLTIRSYASIGLTYNRKKTRIFTKQQSLGFLGFEIVPKFLLIKEQIYSQAYLNASKEQRKLVLAKARYILRNKRKDGTTRAKTNMPLSKAIALINPLVVNWRNHYMHLIPRSTYDQLDWLLNEKIYRWYVKRLKKNRVTHWNKNCIEIVKNKKRVANEGYRLDLFNDSNA